MTSTFNWRNARCTIPAWFDARRAERARAVLEQDITRKVRLASGFEGAVHWRVDPELPPSLDVLIERQGADLAVFVPDTDRNHGPTRIVIARVPAALSYMHEAGPEVSRMSFNLSDGQVPSEASCAFSSCDRSMTLVPDFYFFRDHGFAEMRAFTRAQNVPWGARNANIFWRGRLTGAGLFSVDSAQRNNALVRQRLRMAMHAAESAVDFRFVSAVTRLEENLLARAGFMAERIPARAWIKQKFAIDIDGFTNTWDNLFHRMLLGNCVLKVESQMGFRQWYYDRLVAFEHFVPIRADLSDLREKIAWVQDHDAEARAIAANGRALAQSLAWPAVMAETAERLRTRFQTPG